MKRGHFLSGPAAGYSRNLENGTALLGSVQACRAAELRAQQWILPGFPIPSIAQWALIYS